MLDRCVLRAYGFEWIIPFQSFPKGFPGTFLLLCRASLWQMAAVSGWSGLRCSWPTGVAWWWCFCSSLCSGAVLLYFNLTSGSAKPKVQDLIHCLSMESVLAVMEEHALFPHHFLSFCVFARTQMLLLLLGNESPEHFFFLWVIMHFNCPEFSMHRLSLFIPLPKHCNPVG